MLWHSRPPRRTSLTFVIGVRTQWWALPLRGFLPIRCARVVVLGWGFILTRFPLCWVRVIALGLHIQRWAGDGLCMAFTPPLGGRRCCWRSGPSWAAFRPLRRSPRQHWVWGSLEVVWGDIKRQERSTTCIVLRFHDSPHVGWVPPPSCHSTHWRWVPLPPRHSTCWHWAPFAPAIGWLAAVVLSLLGHCGGSFDKGAVGDLAWGCRGGRGVLTSHLWWWKDNNNENKTRLSSVSFS